jgi:hypothetical protein
MENNLIGGVSDIKYVNLPVNIKNFVDIKKDYINDLELEYGSTYSFIISYGNPLTNRGVPYAPLKLTMIDIKGPLYIQNSVLKDTSIKNGWTLDDYTLIYENVKGWKNTISVGEKGELVNYKEILGASIWALVTKSDLIRGIDANNTYETERDTVVSLGVPGHNVINMSLAYYKTTT